MNAAFTEADVLARARSRRWVVASSVQVERDMHLDRLITAIGTHETLGSRLALSGGTCLHKLWLPEPLRYSEDVDYIMCGERDLSRDDKYYLLKDIAKLGEQLGFHFGIQSLRLKGPFPKVFLRFNQVAGAGTDLRIKIELARSPVDSTVAPVDRSTQRTSEPWLTGSVPVQSMPKEYMAATKVAAIFGRHKGRDLYDLHLYMTRLRVTPADVAPYLQQMKRLDKRFRRWSGNTAVTALEGHIAKYTYLEDITTTGTNWDTTPLRAAADMARDFISQADVLVRPKAHRRQQQRTAPAANHPAPLRPTSKTATTTRNRPGVIRTSHGQQLPRCTKPLPRGGSCGRRKGHPGRCRKNP